MREQERGGGAAVLNEIQGELGPALVRLPVNTLRWNDEVSTALLARYYLPLAHSPQRGNACQLLRDGVEVYPSMLEAIRGARCYVHLETYMFQSDAVGELFGKALVEAVERGV